MNPLPYTPLLLVISAPSGAGKTTLCQNVLAAESTVTRAITCTTRAPRPGERDGTDYFFLARSAFESRLAAGDFLEHATVHGHLYGTLKSEVRRRLDAGQDVLLNIDVQGAASLRRAAAADDVLRRALVTVFLTTATFAELEQRLRGRNQDAPEVVARRLLAARDEMAEWAHFDYLLTSDTREEDLRRLRAILTAERLRQHRAVAPRF